MANNSSFLVNKSLSFNQLSSPPLAPSLWEIYSDYVSGNLLQWNGSAWIQIGTAPTSQYAQAYTGPVAAVGWSTTSATFVDPTPIGTPVLTVRKSSGISLTQAASNLPGITFTPASASAVYLITANVACENPSNTGSVELSLTDGTTEIAESPTLFEAGGSITSTAGAPVIVSGIYVPGTSSTVTIKIQMSAAQGGTAFINSKASYGALIEWTVLRIA